VTVNWPAFTATDKILALDVASGGGIKVLTSFEADHQCASAWGGIVAF
jgi:para-nitrobenzyl esterase